jgi:ubiquitin C-terminal hydrolase
MPLSSEMHPKEFLSNLMNLEIDMVTAAANVYKAYSAAHRASNHSSLDSLLTDFFTEHPLHGQYRCSRYFNATQAQQIFRLRSPLPPVLIIQLKRFMYDSHSHEKINSYISFPLNELNLADYLGTADDSQSGDSSSTVYDLVAVANHMGTVSSGHYTAFCKYYENGQWYCFDDTSVQSLASARDVITKAAYILVYVRKKVE